MIKLIILLIFFIFVIALLIFIVKRVVKVAIFLAFAMVILLVLGSIISIGFRGKVKEKTTEIVGMVVGKVEDKAIDYTKKNINMTKIKDKVIGELE